jgi:hypothetical protein
VRDTAHVVGSDQVLHMSNLLILRVQVGHSTHVRRTTHLLIAVEAMENSRRMPPVLLHVLGVLRGRGRGL